MPVVPTLGEGTSYFSAFSANSRMELDNLASLTGSSLSAQSGGAIICPKLTELSNTTLTKGGPTASLSTGNIRRITRSALHALGGASMGFPLVTGYDAGTDPGSWYIDAFDPGTVLDFPALTHFTGALASFSSVQVRVSNGAILRMPRMVSFGEGHKCYPRAVSSLT